MEPGYPKEVSGFMWQSLTVYCAEQEQGVMRVKRRLEVFFVVLVLAVVCAEIFR